MGATSKQRTPSRCREWERERRNKFNQAIAKLGELIKLSDKENQSGSKDADSTLYPKIEIIQRAILFIQDYSQEKSKLKAEILALQVKLDGNKVQNGKKDVSTQVTKGFKTKPEVIKPTSDLVVSKVKPSALKEKKNGTVNTSEEPTSISPTSAPEAPTVQKLAKILPKSVPAENKGAENTFVVMPGTPYILPQRPLLFPTATPTFVLLNPNMPKTQSQVPIVNRISNEITRTTMVNILPIAAYSRPLSAKGKKTGMKQKSDIAKKKIKTTKKVIEQKGDTSQPNKDTIPISNESNKDSNQINDKIISPTTETVKVALPEAQKSVNNDISGTSKENNSTKYTEVKENVNTKQQTITNTKDMPTKDCSKIKEIQELPVTNNVLIKSTDLPVTTEKCNKISSDKDVPVQSADKNKLSNILDTSLCENTVDGGNARLELAEELLAASPTAAFLMSFPLVSGNRADSPAEETPVVQPAKETNQRRTYPVPQPITNATYFDKANTNPNKDKDTSKLQTSSTKTAEPHKFIESTASSKQTQVKASVSAVATSADNPFLNLPMPSTLSTSCSLADTTFALDFDCNISKSLPSQSTSYGTNSNIFYKDPFNTVKNTIYSTSSISSGHDFNSLGLYPCAMEKYSSKTKTDYSNVEDNLMKMGPSRLTYDIDLGWSHKGFDFVNSTTNSTTFTKDNLLTTVSAPYSSSYNPFNPEFHVPLVSSASNKKENTSNCSKPTSTFVDSIASFYSQPSNFWPEDGPFYSTNSISSAKTFNSKHQNYLPIDNSHNTVTTKLSTTKQYETKAAESFTDNLMKTSLVGMGHQVPDNTKYTKKSPSKMHINWMTSETRPMQNVGNTTSQSDAKEQLRISYGQTDHSSKKQDLNDGNYFPINIHNYPSHVAQEEFPVWPSARPLGTTEISIDPPPINLPTLVGDLALGPHDRKKNADSTHRGSNQTDIQNCNNFLSVTQLMNRSSDNMPARCPVPVEQNTKLTSKSNIPHYTTDINRKIPTTSRLDHSVQPYYSFNDSKMLHTYDTMNQYPSHTSKTKSTKATDKSVKNQKHSYSAEALIRGGTCTQKVPDKFAIPQKFTECPQQDSSVAQVSHFPPILDYSDNSYSGQQFSGTTLYNSTTNTISNSFYSNFMPGGTNLMSSNYAGAPFASEYIDYNQTVECNYSNHKYEEFKIKGNPTAYNHDKSTNNHKGTRREFSAKHKMECSKKDSTKKYQSKRPKLSTEVEDWSESNPLLWQNKAPSKRHSNLMGEDLFPNYNQMGQYQPDIFNAHLVPPNMQSVGHNADRSLTSLPVTSRANFNLSTIFPEITMKVQ
ncbi:unnamed protein product [Plutella xylostella]|uniref:(diamondback moth) hypothetical protein n=1 Tax=Plutella xylostella TaxID=51655 RepID=A0A8S4DD13_PLUXY|nr:unnamed protein product [Plutella xylostella]